MARAAPGALAGLLTVALLAPGALAAPMQGGGDTRDIASIPQVVFEGPVKVRPGESGTLAFTVKNRYNETMQGLQWQLAFEVGGDWLDARNVTELNDPPAFVRSSPSPTDVAPNQTVRFTAPFTTSPRTPPGSYVVSLELLFSYANATGQTAGAHFVSLGSLEPFRRPQVNMSNYSGSLDALSSGGLPVDGIVPDSSMEVEGGGAAGLWWAAAGFGAAVVAAGAAYGWARGRGESGSRR
jgi:hypothetical protein